VAPGPHDQTGMYVMHHAFRRDLRRFVTAVRQTPIGDAPTWRALGRRWGRFAEILHHHHTVEDDYFWPVLIRHAEERGDAEALAMLNAMEDEHAEIDPALIACRQGFQAMVDHPCADHRNALDVHLTGAREALDAHLGHEESEALPFLQQVLSTDEYAVLEAAAGRGYPARLTAFLLPWVMDELPAEARQRILGKAGRPLAILLRLVTPRYARAERRAFRY
jgi:hemerythrin-like domain-containing protein